MTANRFRFRVWDESLRQMRIFCLGDEIDDRWFDHVFFAIEFPGKGRNVMQSTGLTDKNGKEIFEGDILHERGLGPKYPLVVRWWAEAMRFACYRGDEQWEVFFDSTAPGKLADQAVVGNIHEHPHLLTTQAAEG